MESPKPGPEIVQNDEQQREQERLDAMPPEAPALTEAERRMAMLAAARAESADTTADLSATRRERLERLADQGVVAVTSDLDTEEHRLAEQQAAEAARATAKSDHEIAA